MIIVGSGAYGSSLTYHLSRLGAKTLTLERFHLNHTNGSSHGKTRIIRTAYAESPIYVPLLKRAWVLWYELAKEVGVDLIRKTGGLYAGRAEGPIVSGVIESARTHGLEYAILDSKEILDRFRIFRLAEDQVGVYENDAGVLFPERCIEANYNLAKEKGAEYHFGEIVTGVSEDKSRNEVIVTTNKELYSARKVVLACGGWISSLLSPIPLGVKIERQVAFWFAPIEGKRQLFSEGRMPVFLSEEKGGDGSPDFFYAIPDYGDGIKVARHHGGQIHARPECVSRIVTPEDEALIRTFLGRRMPDANGIVSSSSTCIYTDTPDGNFLLGKAPSYDNVIFVSACSGHGFKFASVIGEILAREFIGEPTEYDLSRFAPV